MDLAHPDPTSASPDTPGLRVGVVRGVTLTRWLRAWAERYPAVPVTVAGVAQAEQRAVLDAGGVDVCFVRLPLDVDGLALVPLYEEPAVVVVPRDHPVSLFEAVTLADLARETLLDEAGLPDGADAFDLVAGGVGLLVVPQPVARSRSRRDLVARPVSDLPPSQVGLAWRRDREHPATQDFVGVVRGRRATSSRGTPPVVPARADRAPGGGSPKPGRDAGRRPARRRGRR